MGEIKFKAWDKKKKEWCKDSVYIGQDGWHFCLKLDDHNPDLIILKYTELKDKSGKEIYEGDIVRHLITKTPKDSYTIKSIIFSDGAFRVWGERSLTMLGWISSECIEIIGNIYENPELIRRKNVNRIH